MAPAGGPRPDIVLGDRFGASADCKITRFLKDALCGLGEPGVASPELDDLGRQRRAQERARRGANRRRHGAVGVEHDDAIGHIVKCDAQLRLALADLVEKSRILHRNDGLSSKVLQ